LEPLDDVKYWVNGTMEGQEGEPVTGEIKIVNTDHPLMDHIYLDTGSDGRFSVELYPGNYSFTGYNITLRRLIDVFVNGPLSNLKLVLIPETSLSGIVTDFSDQPQNGSNITLEIIIGDEYQIVQNTITNTTGYYNFTVGKGTYRVIFDGSEIHDRYFSNPVTTDGWTPVTVDIKLINRTVADIYGIIKGEAGPFSSGIPRANVTIMNGDEVINKILSDENGHYFFEDILHGSYWINVTPPKELEPILDIRYGYSPNHSEVFNLQGARAKVDIALPFVDIATPEYVNVTYTSPVGPGVYIDSDILIEFSHTMDTDSVISSLRIQPDVTNLSFKWNELDSILLIEHDDFEPDTNYTIMLLSTVRSFEGYPFWYSGGYSWWFVTGNTTDPWEIYSANISVDENKNVSVMVTAPVNITIFMYLWNVDFIELEDDGNGTYTAMVDGSILEWETEYDYYFTNSYGGQERAPEFSGSFLTPEEPFVPVEWELFEAWVDVDEYGIWDVRAEAPAYLSIYIVIDGIGSFLLDEEDDSIYYRILIPGEVFEYEMEYDYHFSNRSGGADMAPDFSGTITMPEEPSSGSSSQDPPFLLICCIVLVVIIVIIALAVLLIISMKNKREGLEE
jgi:hypothetical protein